jgi:hypothetical protein
MLLGNWKKLKKTTGGAARCPRNGGRLAGAGENGDIKHGSRADT